MATTTTSLDLRKPAGGDAVNVATDLNANFDVIDGMHLKGADIASASAIAISNEEAGAYRDITGTTGVTSIAARNAGQVVRLQFDGVVTLTHNGTSLILPGASDYVTAAGDVMEFMSEGSGNWRYIGGSRPPLHLLDDVDIHFGTGDDAVARWSDGDADNHSLVIALGDSNQGLHITDKGAVATDWAIAATTHPNLFLHSNTTPATDYLRLGGHDGSVAYIDVAGGTTLRLAIAGTNEIDLTATALSPAVNDSNALGTTALRWSDLFVAAGAVLNFDAGNVTIAHAAGKLTFGGSGSVEVDFNNHEMTNVDVNSGAIDGTVIGAAAVAAGSFAAVVGTTITGSGVLSIDDTTESTSTTSGSVHTDGGLGVAGDIYGGDDLALTSSGAIINFNAGDMLITHSSNTLTVSGGTWATAALTASTITGSGVLSIDDTTDSTSGTTGSIHTDGGLGVLLDLVAAAQILATTQGSGGGIVFGTDAQLFRGAANRLDVATGDSLQMVDGAIDIGGLTSNTTLGKQLRFSTGSAFDRYASIQAYRGGDAATIDLLFNVWTGGSAIEGMRIFSNGGLVVGSPSGSTKGAGTINATAVYDDDTLLTDYVFDDDYPLISIPQMREFYEAKKHLPTIPGRDEWEATGQFSLGKMATRLWETVEVHARYIAELEHEIALLRGP
jgi:hypothetical protein